MRTSLWQARGQIEITTGGFSVHDVTGKVAAWLVEEGAREGLLTGLVQHTSASMVIMENADPDVMADLMDSLAHLAPEDATRYRHGTEGPDDMPAHIRTALTQTHLSIPITDGRMDLGMWQGIWLLEHRKNPQRRTLTLHYVGE